MSATIDKKIYSDSVVSKAIYWLCQDYTIRRATIDADTEQIEFIGLDDESTKVVVAKLMALLNDYKLREIIANETREIKVVLYAAAFAEDEDLKEEDIHD